MTNFEQMLSGGHPNSLGRTLEVVDQILADKSKLADLYDCYFSKDEVVRLRVSNAFKRVCKLHPDWVAEYLDKFINEIAKINQASTKWTLAQLFMLLDSYLSEMQRASAIKILQKNLDDTDWIVLNFTMEALTKWAKDDPALATWLRPKLVAHSKDSRKSVARRAEKFLQQLS